VHSRPGQQELNGRELLHAAPTVPQTPGVGIQFYFILNQIHAMVLAVLIEQLTPRGLPLVQVKPKQHWSDPGVHG